MTEITKVDKRISDIAGEIELYTYLTPLNREREEAKFFKALWAGKEYNPEFEYRARQKTGHEKELQEIRDRLRRADGIGCLLLARTEHLLRELELLRAGDESFRDRAVNLHGKPDREAVDTALDILEKSRNEADVFPEETVSPEEMADAIRKTLSEKQLCWNVRISGKIVPKITVSGGERTIYINSRVHYTPQEVGRLKVHEVEVHIYRGANGHEQPYRIMAEGTAGYDTTEEGLAIIAEEITGCLKLDTRQMKLYAGRALAAELAFKGSFYEGFRRLSEYFPDDIAYRIAQRMKRGMRNTSRPGGLTKGYHYIRGWLDVKRFRDSGGDIGLLYLGKIGIGDIEIAGGMLDEGELVRPKYLPDFL